MTNNINGYLGNDINVNKINVIKNPVPAQPIPIKHILKKNIPGKEDGRIKIQNNISYDDILNNMGLHINNGELQLVGTISSEKNNLKEPLVKMECSKVKCGKLQKDVKKQCVADNKTTNENEIPQNSYIYNKYFKQYIKPNPTETFVPKTLNEYRQFMFTKLLEKRAQQLRIRQIKSTKLIMPNENIRISSAKVNNIPSDRFFRYQYFKTNEKNLIYPLHK